jgi:hypothetical protein
MRTYTRPKFDRNRYIEYDRLGKEAGVNFLCYLLNNPEIEIVEENYKDDIVVNLPDLGNKEINVQVEIRTTWKGDMFPYKSFRLSKSKVEDCLERNDVVWFLVFNSTQDSVGLLRLSKSTPKKVTKKFNRYSLHKPEEFYEFELDLVDFY